MLQNVSAVDTRNSAFTYKGRAVDVRQVGRELGVRYALEGSVRRAARRVRVACELVGAGPGAHVWAERFDSDLADVFDLQDQVTESVAGAIEPSLQRAEVERARHKPTDNLDAYDLHLRALPHFHAASREGNEEALVLLRRAIALDPGYAPAKGFAALCQTRRVSQGWAAAGDREEGERFARETLAAAGGGDPTALAYAAHALGFLAFDHDQAVAAAEHALALNPNSAQIRHACGFVSMWLCDAEAAAGHLWRAIRLSPLDPDMSLFLAGLAHAHLIAGRCEEALAHGWKAVREKPALAPAHRVTVAALSLLGRREEAAAAARRYRQAAPAAARVLADRLRALFLDRRFADALIGELRDAGLPE